MGQIITRLYACIFECICIVYVAFILCVGTGRGLMALKYFKPGDVVISLPENVLITSGSILNSSVGPVLRRCVKNCNVMFKVHKTVICSSQLKYWV